MMAGQLQRQAGLADAAGARERQERAAAQEHSYLAQLMFTAEEGAERPRKIVLRVGLGSDRRGTIQIGERVRSASTLDGLDEGGAIRLREVKRPRKQAHGVAMRHMGTAPFEIADRANTDGGTLGEFLLG